MSASIRRCTSRCGGTVESLQVPVTGKSGGGFEISGLQNNVVKTGTKYSGTGNLIIHLANNSSGGYDRYPPIPVKINIWDVPDGLNVRPEASTSRPI